VDTCRKSDYANIDRRHVQKYTKIEMHKKNTTKVSREGAILRIVVN